MTEDKIRKKLAEYSKKTYHRGLVGGTGGNFSVRLGQDRMLITPFDHSFKGRTSIPPVVHR
jgi:ribulose-5-phosphate 4-epimerase/fuculose-1-phosphate aldolase